MLPMWQIGVRGYHATNKISEEECQVDCAPEFSSRTVLHYVQTERKQFVKPDTEPIALPEGYHRQEATFLPRHPPVARQ